MGAKKEAGFLGILVVIYVVAWLIQEKLFLSWDVSNLLQSTKLMLAGGNYTEDFFIANPPMILFLYAPPILLSKWLVINIVVVFRWYIFLISSVSFVICCFFAGKIFLNEDKLLRHLFLLALAVTFLVLPLYELGQRDCLMYILLMPYLLLSVCRLQGATINERVAMLVGAIAGFGVGIKPQFIIMPILIELYYGVSIRKWLSWRRIETESMMGVLVIYVTIIFTNYPEYIFTVVPYLLTHYYKNVSDTWQHLVLFPLVLICWVPLPLFVVQCRNKPYQHLGVLLFIAWLGSMFLYLSQGTLYLYHIVPLLSVTLLLLVLIFSLIFLYRQINYAHLVVMAVSGIIAGIFIYYISNALVLPGLIFYPERFFGFVYILFVITALLEKKNINLLKTLFLIAFIVLVGAWYSYIISHTSWYEYLLSSTTLLLLMMYSVFILKHSQCRVYHLYVVSLAAVLFSYIFFVMQNQFNLAMLYKNNLLKPLVVFMQSQPPKQKIYVLSESGYIVAPMVDYTNSILNQRVDCMWMNAEMLKMYYIEGRDAVRLYIQKNQNTINIINIVAGDLHVRQPDLVFVDVNKPNARYNDAEIYFNFPYFYSENKQFRDEWSHYKYLTTLDKKYSTKALLKIDVYRRIK